MATFAAERDAQASADGAPGADLGAPTPGPSSNADGADPVMPALPAPGFDDATIDALEAEVKQNKK